MPIRLAPNRNLTWQRNEGIFPTKACTTGRDNECRRAKYVHGSSLTGRVDGGGIAASYGGTIATSICLALGVPTADTGALLCAVTGGTEDNECLGRQVDCRSSKIVESSSLAGSVGGGLVGAFAGNILGVAACGVVLGIASEGPVAIDCGVAGGTFGVMLGGKLGSDGGELMGNVFYERVVK